LTDSDFHIPGDTLGSLDQSNSFLSDESKDNSLFTNRFLLKFHEHFLIGKSIQFRSIIAIFIIFLKMSGKWLKGEDDKLKSLCLGQEKPRCTIISQEFGNKTAKQCRDL
jgi:hypothetical protein